MLFRIAFAGALVVQIAAVQPPEEDITAKFEAASITNADRAGGWGLKVGPASLTMTNVSLRMLIHYAWALDGAPESDPLITGGPRWIDSETYDVIAKAGAAVPRSEIMLMLRALLIERLGIQSHWEHKVGWEYSLVPGKNGPKLRKADPEDRSYGILCPLTTAQFCKLLVACGVTDYLPVVDKTGLDAVHAVAE